MATTLLDKGSNPFSGTKEYKMKKFFRILKDIIMYSFEVCIAILLFVIGILVITTYTLFSKNDGEKKE